MGKSNIPYLMESPEESLRLDIKTDVEAVRKQALWCGLKPGMRVLDAGCGSGKTSSILYEMIQPGGELIAVDFSEDRIAYAQKKYGGKAGLKFMLHDLREPTDEFGNFDLIWTRFLLEYYYIGSIDVVKTMSNYLKPGGLMCLLDSDHNSLNHYEISAQMQNMLSEIVNTLKEEYNFDFFIGRKLYSFLFDLGYQDISVELMAHHLFYGDLTEKEFFNWQKKIEVIIKRIPQVFQAYPGGSAAFQKYFISFLNNRRRFSYTPLIVCKGTKTI
jgi:SAM-dependent methyltransferase